jgi:hypothetical protein
MFVTFHSDAWNSVTMFGDVAIKFLKMMGHSGTVPSAVLADDVPAALTHLQRALAAAGPEEKTGQNQPKDDKEDALPPIKLGQRAFPLIELLTAAAQKHCDVVWEEGNRMV